MRCSKNVPSRPSKPFVPGVPCKAMCKAYEDFECAASETQWMSEARYADLMKHNCGCKSNYNGIGHTGKSSCSLASAASKTAAFWALEASRLASLALSAALVALTPSKAALLTGRRLSAFSSATGPTTSDAAQCTHKCSGLAVLTQLHSHLRPYWSQNGALSDLRALRAHRKMHDVSATPGLHLCSQGDPPHSRIDGSIQHYCGSREEYNCPCERANKANCTYVLCCSVGSKNHEGNCEEVHCGGALAPPQRALMHPADQAR